MNGLRLIQIFLSHTGEMSEYANRVRNIVSRENSHWEDVHKVTVRVLTFEDISSSYSVDGVQAIINQFMEGRYDIYLGIMGHKFGAPTKNFGSGTEEEYKTAVAEFVSGRSRVARVMFGFCEVPLNPFSIDLKNLKKTKAFRKEMQSNLLYFSWESDDRFEEVIRKQLSGALIKIINDPKNSVPGRARYI
ncbi:DUF4062 domain-containing protein [Methylobacterium sp. DB0501]|uniref:DUF4062 domain-containing protein n=1 Tax=Methylobacterium sp. DB0501 TaxID=2709665 RepID=UPI0013E9EF14|nr:DUF4062 domain-containing protein [Methylobacterium sp. DB0501]NGM32525.1 DUF4062 domain-containing protein [Methylobacterium sp. DB0501]